MVLIEKGYYLLKPSLKNKSTRPAGVLSPIRTTGAIWILGRKKTPLPLTKVKIQLLLILCQMIDPC